MIYCSFCLQFYPTFTLPLKLTKIVNVLCSIIVIVSTAMRFFFLFFQISVARVFCACVCLGYCSQLVLWLLSLALYVNTARETASLALLFGVVFAVEYRVLTLLCCLEA